MKFIILLIVLICGLQIYRNKGEARLSWFLGSMLLMGYAGFIERPHLPANRLFLLAYVFSMWRNKELQHFRFPLKIPFIIYLIGLFFISINAVHLNLFYKIYKPLMFLLESYGVVIIGFISAKSCKCWPKSLTSILLLVTFYGIYTFLTHSDPLRLIITPENTDFFVNQYLFGERTRIASTWSHPISYGFICCVFFFVAIRSKQLINPQYYIVILILLALNILICGSRTVLLCFFIMISFYVLISFNLKSQVRYILTLAIIGSLSFALIPSINNKIEELIATIQGSSDTGGSSLEMREMQLNASLAVASQFPITGGGLDYTREVMGLGTDSWNKDYAAELLGLESIIYIIIIERGLIGIIIELIMTISILYYALKRRWINKKDSGMIFTLETGFIVFAISTGTLDTWTLTMFFIGYFIYRAHHPENQYRINQ